MSNEGSITLILGQLRAGEEQGVAGLCARYFNQLVEVARARLPVRFRRAADEEDVAQSALRTFVRRAGAGEFLDVATGRDLWGLLARITVNKALKLLERECRQKRGSGRAPENPQVLDDLFARSLAGYGGPVHRRDATSAGSPGRPHAEARGRVAT